MRRFPWPVPVLAAFAFLAGTAWMAPDARLRQEIVEARRERLWLTGQDLRHDLAPTPWETNAAPDIDSLSDFPMPAVPKDDDPSSGGRAMPVFTVDGTWIEAERETQNWLSSPTLGPVPTRLRNLLGESTEKLARWRDASTKDVDYQEQEWERPRFPLTDGHVFALSTECSPLLAAAALGPNRRANLAAAARLVALIGQDPRFESQEARAKLGQDVLKVARSISPEAEGEAARLMGPSIDPRRILLAYLPAHLEALRKQQEARSNLSTLQNALEILKRSGVLRKRDTIRGFRAMMKRLPADPVVAEPRFHGEFERLQRLAESQSSFGEISDVYSWDGKKSIAALARFETERRKALRKDLILR